MTLYEQVLEVARVYMGPAAEDYIQRRIRIVQQGEDPRTVTVDKLERLAVGVEMTAKRYMSQSRAEKFRDEIRRLAETG